MKTTPSRHMRSLALLLCGLLAAGPVLADKPSWAGGGKHDRYEDNDRGRGDDDHGHGKHGGGKHGGGDHGDRDGRNWHEGDRYFSDDHRAYLNSYYASEYSHGRCPPGLAKKHNGCMPPGQAKKWAIGQPLPRGVVYAPLPAVVVARIGPPPSGYRYVQVAGDVLMIAIGTSMVMDAIQDLGR